MALSVAFHFIAVLLKGTSHSHGLLAWLQTAAGSLAAVLACQLQMAALLCSWAACSSGGTSPFVAWQLL